MNEYHRKWNKKVENQPIFIYEVVGSVCDTDTGCIRFVNIYHAIFSSLASYEHCNKYNQSCKVTTAPKTLL